MAKQKATETATAAASTPSRNITVNVDEFKRTRDALTTAWISLSSSIDNAVKAYITHTDMVMRGDAVLNTSLLLEPFNALSSQLSGAIASATSAGDDTAAPAVKPGKKEKKKKTTKPKDPNAPKRPLTAYFRFLNEVRPHLITEGTHKPREISTLATERWKALTEAEQQRYKDAYLKDMEGYNIVAAEYARTHGILPPADEDEDEVFAEALTEPAAVKPSTKTSAPALTYEDSDSDSDSDSSDDDEAAALPPPPPPKSNKKASSAENVLKTPKSAKKSNASQPMFSSINPPTSSAVPASSNKKRKSEGAIDASAKKDKKKKIQKN